MLHKHTHTQTHTHTHTHMHTHAHTLVTIHLFKFNVHHTYPHDVVWTASYCCISFMWALVSHERLEHLEQKCKF